MLANDIKKGMKIVLNSGFEGEMSDNRKGNIRTVRVLGIMGWEVGSAYIWDIMRVQPVTNGDWERVELSEKQKQSKYMVKAFGF